MRYFIVFYTGRITGVFTVVSENYPNAYETTERIASKYNQAINTIVLTNIIELSEVDFHSFIKK